MLWHDILKILLVTVSVPISEVAGSISDPEKDTKFIGDSTAKTRE